MKNSSKINEGCIVSLKATRGEKVYRVFDALTHNMDFIKEARKYAKENRCKLTARMEDGSLLTI